MQPQMYVDLAGALCIRETIKKCIEKSLESDMYSRCVKFQSEYLLSLKLYFFIC